ncbi:MAG: NRDE family protein [Xanthomonadaceae bacterium]|nr:NRDE family protein [Xanthomonadaceae bacterium]MDP2185436.1 NRDE family protein [Xanthomonadales bacterium]MDZ4116216.1 NRDE family protein [Xanthomonadaceae bacterium]MDZ4377004.1 NRDE family protein [Xanthomonadaceae bacterium]
MCLIALAWHVHPRYPLVLVANRDEFHARPTTPAAVHPTQPQLFGGRDLEKGGSWLMVSSRGRMAAVTNVRLPQPVDPDAASRGHLVTEFAQSDVSAVAYGNALADRAAQYAHFNLLAWDGADLVYAGTHPEYESARVEPGVHVLSNAGLNSPWPKALRLRQRLRDWLEQSDQASPSIEPLFAALADREQASDTELPNTGVGIERERFLSAPFIVGADYGTRCSTIVLANDEGITFIEHRFAPLGVYLGEVQQTLRP